MPPKTVACYRDTAVILLVLVSLAHGVRDPSSEGGLVGGPDGVDDFYMYLMKHFNQVPAAYDINGSEYARWSKAMQDRNIPIVGELRHVSFKEFIQGFEVQMAGVENALNERNKTEKADCVVSFWRDGSGKSVDDNRKSYGWMMKIFKHYMDLKSPPSLKSCFERGIHSTKAMCPEQKVVLVIEDVSYSGIELYFTVAQILKCKKSELVFGSVAFWGDDSKELWDDTNNPKVRLPWDLAGKESDKYNFHLGGPRREEGLTSPWVYFDHKMADSTSLEDNLQAARGAVEEDPEITDPQLTVIPFITGCEAIHRCAARKNDDDLCGRLNCPYAPYKNQSKMVIRAQKCNCSEAAVEQARRR